MIATQMPLERVTENQLHNQIVRLIARATDSGMTMAEAAKVVQELKIEVVHPIPHTPDCHCASCRWKRGGKYPQGGEI